MKPTIEKIGYESTKKSFHFFRREELEFQPFWHYHPELELTLITNGSGMRFIGDNIMPYTKNDLVLIGSNLPHHWVSFKKVDSAPQAATVFQFRETLFAGFPECDGLGNLFSAAKRGLHYRNPDEKLVETILNFDSYPELKRFSMFFDILFELSMDFDRVGLSNIAYERGLGNDKNQSKITKTTSFVLEHLQEKLTIAEMADRTNMVPQSFCRWFKSMTGRSFITFLNMARITKASQYLITTDTPIQEIAYICGFESISHFNRTFKIIKKKSPRELRNKGINKK